MKKLTKQEASELIEQAWEDVSRHTLGSYRFGQVLWCLLPNYMTNYFLEYGEDGRVIGYLYTLNFFYEPDSNIATEKFYKYFVEGCDE